MTLEYCEHCLAGTCQRHKWFGKPKTEDEVLIITLKQLCGTLPSIIEKVYLAETVLCDGFERFSSDGNIEFTVKTVASHKKEPGGYYVPVIAYSNDEKGIIDFNIVINASISRHNPIILRIYDNLISSKPLESIDLIDFNDGLHCESIDDYSRIVSLAKKRLKHLIESIGRTLRE